MSEEEQRGVKQLISGAPAEKPPALTDLVSVSGEAAALHGAGVEVALVVKLEARQARVQLVQDGRKAPPQSQQLGAGAVEANTHGALQGHASSVTQQGAGRKAEIQQQGSAGPNESDSMVTTRSESFQQRKHAKS